MRLRRSAIAAVVAAAVVLLGAVACSSKDVVTCDPARHGAECLQGGITGTCVSLCDGSASYCAFPAPSDCPGSGLKFGVLSGDESTRCVATCPATDGDAGVADGGLADAGPVPPSTVYVSIALANEMALFDADHPASLGAVTLPATDPAGYRMFQADHYLWMGSHHHVVKYDLDTRLVAPGYPRYFDGVQDCDPFSSVFGPEGWTCIHGEVLQRWTGEPLQSGISRSATAPSYLVRSDRRIFLIGGQNHTSVAVHDIGTLNEAPGSPLAGTEIIGVVSSSAMDRTVLVSWASSGAGLYLYRESTLESLGSVVTPTSSLPFTVAFDTRRHRIVASLGGGFLSVYSPDDMSLLVPPKSVSAKDVMGMRYEPIRDRFYAVAGFSGPGELLVLDGATLDHVAGSPVVMESSGSSIALH